MTPKNEKPVWFITGCSTGFGRELAQHLLTAGYRVVITARKPEQIAALAIGHEERALVLALDVTVPEQITHAVQATEQKFGRIDVLVNNAGIGYFGSFEESDLLAVRRMFDINVWGLTGMARAVLPRMRKQRSGTIVNLSSIGGIAASSALSFYNATKFAVEALSESLSHEVAPLGIKVLLVEPGPFRTDWAGRSAGEASTSIADYEETAGARKKLMRDCSGKQPGDPKRAVAAIVKAVEAPQPPLRLLLGKVALDVAEKKLNVMKEDFDAWKDVSISADFPE